MRQSNSTAPRRLAVYKKAPLGDQFKWELKDFGYGNKFVDMAAAELIF